MSSDSGRSSDYDSGHVTGSSILDDSSDLFLVTSDSSDFGSEGVHVQNNQFGDLLEMNLNPEQHHNTDSEVEWDSDRSVISNDNFLLNDTGENAEDDASASECSLPMDWAEPSGDVNRDSTTKDLESPLITCDRNSSSNSHMNENDVSHFHGVKRHSEETIYTVPNKVQRVDTQDNVCHFFVDFFLGGESVTSSDSVFMLDTNPKRNAKGETPLQLACIKGDVNLVRTLLENGANPNTKDNGGWTPLHEASSHGFLEIVQLLLQAGALVDVPGSNNMTPLHDAVISNDVDIAVTLIKHGANKDARNALGETPRDLAHSEMMVTALQSTELTKVAMVRSISIPFDSLIVLPVGLSPLESLRLSEAAQKYNFQIVNVYRPEVILLVVSSFGRVCVPSVPVLNGILQGKWIVASQWIWGSLEEDRLADPRRYELEGTCKFPVSGAPAKARRSSLLLPGLLDGCHLFLTHHAGPYRVRDVTVTRDELISLVRSAGGKLLSRLPDPERVPPREQVVPYHAAPTGPLAQCAHYVIYYEAKPLLRYNMRHFRSLPVDWLLACVETFTLLDPADFV